MACRHINSGYIEPDELEDFPPRIAVIDPIKMNESIKNVFAVIPARGGSTRIPHKNIKLINGIPAIIYAITTAYCTGIFKDIIVSTDDEEIVSIAKLCGKSVLVPFMRPPELSDNYTPIADVMKHAVEYLSEHGYDPDIVCCIYPVSPMMKMSDLKAGFEKISNNPNLDYVFSAVKKDNRVARAFTAPPVRMLREEFYATRSQDLPNVYRDAAMFYFGRAEAWVEKRMIFSNRSEIVEIPEERGIDVDTLEDWDKMERTICHKLPDAICKKPL